VLKVYRDIFMDILSMMLGSQEVMVIVVVTAIVVFIIARRNGKGKR